MSKEVEQIVWKMPTGHAGPWRLGPNDFIASKNLIMTEVLLVHFAPGDKAANHCHDQQEILVGLAGDLYLIWRDSQGERHEERLMREDGALQAFIIAPQVPHLIENRSANRFGTMQVWEGIVDEPIELTGTESLDA